MAGATSGKPSLSHLGLTGTASLAEQLDSIRAAPNRPIFSPPSWQTLSQL